MKKIGNNPYNLSVRDINVITNKVRALIIDDNNNLILTKYADIYMLPGGKIDDGENEVEALKRELKEELGIEVEDFEIKPLIQFENYLKDYPVVGSLELKNKLNNTCYFVIKTNKNVDIDKVKLTEREKKNNFEVLIVNLNEIISLVADYNSNNPRNLAFKTELIKVLKEFINSQKIIDMHTHSFYSDGEMSPNDLIKYAILNNVGTIAITDHDTLKGVKKINRYDNFIINSGINVINGIELTSKAYKGRMHILGYGIDINNKDLNDKMIELKNNSINNFISLLSQINMDYGISFSYDDIKNVVNLPGNIGRPDIAKLCVKYGYVNSVQEAFDKYLVDAYNKIRNYKKILSYEECIKLILNSGGIPVLAHPKTLELSEKDLLLLIEKMVKLGLKGIEVYHSDHNKDEEMLYLEIAKKFNLLVSGGSDFHGKTVKPDVEIGVGKNNLLIKELSLLDKSCLK